MINRAPPHLPFLDGPVTISPKLKPIDPSHWFIPDTEATLWLSDKRALMRERRDDVFATTGIGQMHANEAAAFIRSKLQAPERNKNWSTSFEEAASLISDDVCLMVRTNEGWILALASVCAPTFWRLADKIGATLGGLHVPLPDGDPKLASRVSRVFDNLSSDRVLERFNWTVQFGSERFTPTPQPLLRKMQETPEAEPARELYLRVERQTIRKLLNQQTIVFTIRVCLDPLRPLLLDPANRDAFKFAWNETDPKIRDYKGWPHYDAAIFGLLTELERN